VLRVRSGVVSAAKTADKTAEMGETGDQAKT
jgi:hypothetical protein